MLKYRTTLTAEVTDSGPQKVNLTPSNAGKVSQLFCVSQNGTVFSVSPLHLEIIVYLPHFIKSLALVGWIDGSTIKSTTALPEDPSSIPGTCMSSESHL